MLLRISNTNYKSLVTDQGVSIFFRHMNSEAYIREKL